MIALSAIGLSLPASCKDQRTGCERGSISSHVKETSRDSPNLILTDICWPVKKTLRRRLFLLRYRRFRRDIVRRHAVKGND
jgi:hypothetical protein